MKAYLTVLTVVLGLACSAAGAEDEVRRPQVDGIYNIGTYCRDEASARTLSNAMARNGFRGFVGVMESQVSCWHADMHPYITIARVKLMEKQWEVTLPSGAVMEFWTAIDPSGLIGWTWFLVAEGST